MYKAVVAGADVVVVIDPATEADADLKAGFGWQGGPAGVLRIVAPGDPAGAPLGAGDPDPADGGDVGPAAIVVDGPAVGFVGVPGPTDVGVEPATVAVGAPAGVDVAGLPAVAVVADFTPVAVGVEIFIEEVERDGAAVLGAGCACGEQGEGEK